MTRRKIREQIFKLLFRIEFNALDDMPEQCRLFFEDDEIQFSEQEEDYIQKKYEKICEKIKEIDRQLEEKAEGWKPSRMSKVDLTILRLAIFELLFDEEIPTGVAINEAVELAKTFGQDESAGFVNGILAKFA